MHEAKPDKEETSDVSLHISQNGHHQKVYI